MWRLDLSKLKKLKLRDYAIRFLFGGAISILAALIAHWTTGRIGGIFTAFPAILLASLTIINRKEGKDAAAADARGGVVGAVALVIAAIVLSLTLMPLAGVWSLLLTLAAWLACGIALYIPSFKAGWLRLEEEK